MLIFVDVNSVSKMVAKDANLNERSNTSTQDENIYEKLKKAAQDGDIERLYKLIAEDQDILCHFDKKSLLWDVTTPLQLKMGKLILP